MHIQVTSESDWRILRDVRLHALADAPYAFAARLEDELEHPESFWRERAAGRLGPESANFLAMEASRAAGMVAVFRDTEAPGTAHLVALWVHPSARRRGTAGALVQAVIGWARERRMRELRLWVADGNQAAAALYRRTGFEATGRRQPLPSDPSMQEEMYSLSLVASIAEAKP